MSDAEIKEAVRQKRFLIDAFLWAPPTPSGADREAALKQAVTGYYLQAVVLELLVKVLVELDLRKPAKHTHNLTKLFEQLPQATQHALVQMYDGARRRRTALFRPIDPDVMFPPLAVVLVDNERIVKDFKYDAIAARGNYAADGEFYQGLLRLIETKVAQVTA